MNEILSYSMCLLVLIIMVIGTIRKTLERRSVNFSIERVLYYFSILISILIIALKIDIILKWITCLVNVTSNLVGIYNDIFKIVLLLVTFFLIQLILYGVMRTIIIPIVSVINKNNNVLLIGISSVIGLFKGIIILAIIFIGLIIYNNTIGKFNKIEVFTDNKLYSKLSTVLSENTSEFTDEIVENFLPASNVIIYYNGVMLEDGVRSTEEIDEKAKELTQSAKTDIDKARILYSWIGSNLEYDYERAERALNNEKVDDSGAITAFKTKSGICFDYSCLYVAMSRAIDLKVRLLTGSAFDGKQYGPHAWNEVYISELDKWIPVDTTFYSAGDYFNNYDFYEDHIIDSIAGEW